MKVDLHPKYFSEATIRCSCGNIIVAGSTRENLKTELCSKCHPFYTGQQKLVDTAGRVDKFQAKRKKAIDLKEESRRLSAERKKKPEAYVEKVVPEEVIARATAKEAVEKSGKWGKPLGDAPAVQVAKEEAKEEARKTKVAVKKPAKKVAMKKVAAKKAVTMKTATSVKKKTK